MHTYIYNHIHTYLPASLHTYIHHTYLPSCWHTYLHTDIHTYLSTYLDTYIQIYIRTYRQTDRGTDTNTDIRTQMHTYGFARSTTWINTHIIIYKLSIYMYIRVANWWTKFASSWCCFLSGRNGEQNFGDVWSGNREGAGSLFLGDDCCGSLLIRLLML